MDKTTAQRVVASTFKAAFDRGRFRDFLNELCNGFDESKKQTMQVPDAFFDLTSGEIALIESALASTRSLDATGEDEEIAIVESSAK
ncbi:MAG: hypothetical protein WC003_09235 [Terrimicrobiaceae bacterium]